MRARIVVAALLLGCVAATPVLTPARAQTVPNAPLVLTYSQPISADAVRRVQEKLKSAGAFDGAVDGTWGSESQAALQRFQQGNGLQPTGQLNPATLAVLGLTTGDLMMAAAAAPPPAPAPAATAAPAPAPTQASAPPPPPADPRTPFRLSTDSVRIVQSRLRQLGYYTGEVDGVWGGGTQVGMQSFERSRNLPVTAGLNGQTVTAMGIDPASMVPQ